MQVQMLKPIVQHKTIDGTLFKHPSAEAVSIRTDRDNGLRATLRNQIRFVAGLVAIQASKAGTNSGRNRLR